MKAIRYPAFGGPEIVRLGAAPVGELDREGSGPAGAVMDEHPLPGLEVRVLRT
jgi:hypothetical protein